jgi:hypothetical protein
VDFESVGKVKHVERGGRVRGVELVLDSAGSGLGQRGMNVEFRVAVEVFGAYRVVWVSYMLFLPRVRGHVDQVEGVGEVESDVYWGVETNWKKIVEYWVNLLVHHIHVHVHTDEFEKLDFVH